MYQELNTLLVNQYRKWKCIGRKPRLLSSYLWYVFSCVIQFRYVFRICHIFYHDLFKTILSLIVRGSTDREILS